jgi:hypothetical protein
LVKGATANGGFKALDQTIEQDLADPETVEKLQVAEKSLLDGLDMAEFAIDGSAARAQGPRVLNPPKRWRRARGGRVLVAMAKSTRSPRPRHKMRVDLFLLYPAISAVFYHDVCI